MCARGACVAQVESPEDSARRVVAEALAQPPGAALALLAHNGPAGLGSAAHSICGVDFLPQEVRAGLCGPPSDRHHSATAHLDVGAAAGASVVVNRGGRLCNAAVVATA